MLQSAAERPVESASDAGCVYMSNSDLQRRFGVSHETLKRWRAAGTGPRYTRFGSRIRYRLSDILAFEAERTFVSSADEEQQRAS